MEYEAYPIPVVNSGTIHFDVRLLSYAASQIAEIYKSVEDRRGTIIAQHDVLVTIQEYVGQEPQVMTGRTSVLVAQFPDVVEDEKAAIQFAMPKLAD